MWTVILMLLSLAAGSYFGVRYGRAAEQKAVTTAVNDLAGINAAAAEVRNKLATRLTYLKKVF